MRWYESFGLAICIGCLSVIVFTIGEVIVKLIMGFIGGSEMLMVVILLACAAMIWAGVHRLVK